MDCLEWVGESWQTGCVGKFHLVSFCPVFGVLLQLVEGLAARVRIIALLKSPVELLLLIPSELWKLCAVDTKNLVSEFLCIFFNHFFNSALLKGSFIKSNGIKALESKSENASLTILDSLLAIRVGLEVFLEFLLFVEISVLTFLN